MFQQSDLFVVFVGWVAQLSMLNNLQKSFPTKSLGAKIYIAPLLVCTPWTIIVSHIGKANAHSFRPASLCAIPAP